MAATNCHTIDRYFVANSPLGVQLYKYHTYLQWCENGTKITSTPAHYGYFSNVDGLDERVVTANLANEVQPLNPSTYAIWTKGEIENCIFHYGCIGTKYPQQKIWYYAGRGITNTRYYNPDDGRGWRS